MVEDYWTSSSRRAIRFFCACSMNLDSKVEAVPGIENRNIIDSRPAIFSISPTIFVRFCDASAIFSIASARL